MRGGPVPRSGAGGVGLPGAWRLAMARRTAGTESAISAREHELPMDQRIEYHGSDARDTETP
jgi:hypothetical protein